MAQSGKFLLAASIALALTHPMTFSCPRPYKMLNGFCLFWNLTKQDKKVWCDAARFCHGINGELALGIERARAARHLSPRLLWLGATDFLWERHRNRTGWLMTNGTEFPEFGDDDWTVGTPDNAWPNDDGLAVRQSGLMDATAGGKHFSLCQPIETPNSGSFKQSEFLQLGEITPNYCYTEIAIENEHFNGWFQCLRACASRWECRAALVNTDIGVCRMLDYSDSSVGDAIEKDPAWRRFVKLF